MREKQKPCTVGPKHKWAFVKNVTIQNTTYRPSGTQVSIKYRGLYKCACGSQRIGRSQDSVKGGA